VDAIRKMPRAISGSRISVRSIRKGQSYEAHLDQRCYGDGAGGRRLVHRHGAGTRSRPLRTGRILQESGSLLSDCQNLSYLPKNPSCIFPDAAGSVFRAYCSVRRLSDWKRNLVFAAGLQLLFRPVGHIGDGKGRQGKRQPHGPGLPRNEKVRAGLFGPPGQSSPPGFLPPKSLPCVSSRIMR